MRSTRRKNIPGRLLTMLIASLSLLIVTGVPASASLPSNDEITGATPITSLPMHDAIDLTQATWNYSTDWSSCSGYGHSVWYEFTPATDQQIAFDPSSSNQAAAVDVFTGSPDALTFVGCGQGSPHWTSGGYILNAIAGTTYWIMASPICCGTPALGLDVYTPAPAQASLTISSGTVDRGGNVTVSGTLDCTGTVPNRVFIYGNVRQSIGRQASVSATFSTTIPCTSAYQWSALAQPGTGKFVGGPATINTTAYLCNVLGCVIPSSTTIVTLRR